MAKHTQPQRKDYLQSILYILLYVALIGMGAWLLLPRAWYAWVGIVLIGMLLLVQWHKRSTVYRCPNCDHVYAISFFTDLAAPHGIDRDGAWLLLRCPNCRKRQKTRVLKRVK